MAEYVFDTKHDRYPVAVHVFLIDAAGRILLMRRVDIFFVTSTWVGVPEISEPHKCTELVWADPAQLPDDTLDFLGQAWADARDGHAFREYGCTPISV